MSSFKEAAEGYEPQQLKNIADLESVDINANFEKVTKEKSDGSTYEVSVLRIEGEEYRVPNSVLEKVQTILKQTPDLKKVRVVKSGEGLKTSYTVVPLQ